VEAIIFDFKQQIKSNTEVTRNNNLPKEKNFTSTLESIKNNEKLSSENPLKCKKEDRKTDSNLDNSNEELVTDNKSDEEPINEIGKVEKKDYKLVYANMYLLGLNHIDAKDTLEKSKDLNLDFQEEVKVLELEGNSENLTQVDEEMFLDTTTFNNQQDKGEVFLDNKDQKADKSQLTDNKNQNEEVDFISNFNTKEISLKEKDFSNKGDVEQYQDKVTTDAIGKVIVSNSEDNEGFNNLDQNDSYKSSHNKKTEDLDLTQDKENDLRINKETLIPFTKDGIEFVKDNPLELKEIVSIDKKEVIQQIVDKVKVDFSEAKNEIRVKLKPEILGEMTMNIEVAKGAITAKIMVDNQRTKEIIEGNLIQLKESIKDTGLEIKTVEVFVGNNGDFDKHSSNGFNLRQNNKKLKIKVQNNKTSFSYGEDILKNQVDLIDEHPENSLNILA